MKYSNDKKIVLLDRSIRVFKELKDSSRNIISSSLKWDEKINERRLELIFTIEYSNQLNENHLNNFVKKLGIEGISECIPQVANDVILNYYINSTDNGWKSFFSSTTNYKLCINISIPFSHSLLKETEISSDFSKSLYRVSNYINTIYKKPQESNNRILAKSYGTFK